MKTLKELIIEALEESKDCIQITYLSKSCEPEIEEDREERAEKIKDVVKAHIDKCEKAEDVTTASTHKSLYIDGFLDGAKRQREIHEESLNE